MSTATGSMLTSYDTLTAGVFEQAGARAAGRRHQCRAGAWLPDTLPVTMDQLISMVQAVVRGTRTALVVADLPFGSYQAGPQAALAGAVRHLKEGGAHAVKLEGGRPDPGWPPGAAARTATAGSR